MTQTCIEGDHVSTWGKMAIYKARERPQTNNPVNALDFWPSDLWEKLKKKKKPFLNFFLIFVL